MSDSKADIQTIKRQCIETLDKLGYEVAKFISVANPTSEEFILVRTVAMLCDVRTQIREGTATPEDSNTAHNLAQKAWTIINKWVSEIPEADNASSDNATADDKSQEDGGNMQGLLQMKPKDDEAGDKVETEDDSAPGTDTKAEVAVAPDATTDDTNKSETTDAEGNNDTNEGKADEVPDATATEEN